jgi:two-component system sensor histidine kinase UhpB
MGTGLNMGKLRVLLVEDSADDAELTLSALAEGGFEVASRLVDSAQAMEDALSAQTWDVVISDYNLPGFDAMAALALLRRSGSDIPFIVVSGCIGEETAVAMMKAGAQDFVMKGNLARLAPAIERELRETAVREERRKAEDALRASEKLVRDITLMMGEGIFVLDQHGYLIFMNREAERLLGWTEMDLFGTKAHQVIHCRKGDGSPFPDGECPVLAEVARGGTVRLEDDVFVRKDGTIFPVSYVTTPIMENGRVFASVTAFQDITRRKLAERELEESRAQLRELSAFLQSVREDERTRIARELHDELGQVMTALKMDLAWMGSRLSPDQKPLVDKTKAMSGLIDLTVEAVYRIAEDLRPVMLDDLGLVPAVEWLVQQFQERTGIESELSIEGEGLAVGGQIATAVFRILQEALTNASRHAEASKVVARLRGTPDEIILEVRDNGRGMSFEQDRKRKSYGLIGIRERTYMLGGNMDIASAPGAGTVLEIRIPRGMMSQEASR